MGDTLFKLPDTHHVGAKPLPLPTDVISSAVYGGSLDCYRYRLEWKQTTPAIRTIMWLMMNPSVASEHCSDRTINRCWAFSQSWSYTRMLIGNTMAYRATDQARLAKTPDPHGPENEEHLLAMAAQADFIVLGYGKPKVRSLCGVGPRIAALLEGAGHHLYALKRAADGTPWHPLYVSGDTVPLLWTAKAREMADG